MPGTFFPPPQVSYPDIHHGTCITHVPWCMPGSLTSGFLWSWWRENVPGFPGACATHNFTYLVRGPLGVREVILQDIGNIGRYPTTKRTIILGIYRMHRTLKCFVFLTIWSIMAADAFTLMEVWSLHFVLIIIWVSAMEVCCFAYLYQNICRLESCLICLHSGGFSCILRKISDLTLYLLTSLSWLYCWSVAWTYVWTKTISDGLYQLRIFLRVLLGFVISCPHCIDSVYHVLTSCLVYLVTFRQRYECIFIHLCVCSHIWHTRWFKMIQFS